MKKIWNSIMYYSIICAILLISSCKKDNTSIVPISSSIPEVEVEVFPDEESDQTVTIEFIDASTGKPIGLESTDVVDVTFTGKDAATVTDLLGTSLSTTTSEKGLLAISTSKMLSETDPLDIKAVAHIDGYVSTSKRIRMYEKGHELVTVSMVKINATPTGVSAIEDKNIVLEASGSTTEVTIESPLVSTSNTKSTVKIPAGTVMKDKNGTPLTGSITSTLVYFNNEDDQSLSSFPGGFDAEVTDKDGNQVDGNFVTAGFISLEMKDNNGTKVKDFSQPITITTEVPASTINPDTDAPIQNGETIDIWSYDTETGDWKYESTATFKGPLANGNFEAVMSASHLSYWNLDWFIKGIGCRVGATININAPELKGTHNFAFEYRYKDGRHLRRHPGYVTHGKAIKFRNASNMTFIMNPVSWGCRPKTWDGNLEFNGCSGEYTFNLTRVKNTSRVTINADVSSYCKQNPGTFIKPTGHIFAYKRGTCYVQEVFRMIKGKVTASNIEVGAIYDVRFKYNGKWHYRTFKVESDKLDYKLTGEIPAGLGCK